MYDSSILALIAKNENDKFVIILFYIPVGKLEWQCLFMSATQIMFVLDKDPVFETMLTSHTTINQSIFLNKTVKHL